MLTTVKPVRPIQPVASLADAIALHYESPVGDRYACSPDRRRLLRLLQERRRQYARRQ